MFHPPKNRSHRDLFDLLCHGIIEDAVTTGCDTFDLWLMVPRHHVGRLNAIGLIRNMASQFTKQFPRGITKVKSSTLVLHPEFIKFAKTHYDMGSTHAEMVEAWAAMQAMDA